MLVKNIYELIGNTPMVEIPKSITGLKNIELYCKCEFLNPFGSLKDRAAFWMIKDQFKNLQDHQTTVIEASSGNTAKALAALCAMHNIKFKTVTNRIKVPEVRDILNLLGAEIEELPGVSECPDPTNPNDPIAVIDNIVSANQDKYYHPNQYTNQLNISAHYKTTGPEILNDLGRVDFLFSALGTTGSSGGIIKYLNSQNQNFKSIGVIGKKGENIPGIRNRDEMQEVGIFNRKSYEDICEVDSTDAVDKMLILNRKLGLLTGPTSGAAFSASLSYLQNIDKNTPKGQKAVFIACDRLEWYISYIKIRRPEIFEKTTKNENIYNLTSQTLSFAREIKPAEIANFVSKNSLVIDLRGNMAYRISHIENAINITDVFMDQLIENGTPFPKDRKILLVCVYGEKSKKYSALLNSRGLDTYSLSGGMIEYKKYTKSLKTEL